MHLVEEKGASDFVTMTQYPNVDPANVRYPFCIVWTPIPMLTWLFPFLGHMGICTSSGVVRDFAGPYYVSEDNMAFGTPTKYWQLDPEKVPGGSAGWDRGIADAAETYKSRMSTIQIDDHNLCCDNCHSMVAQALINMRYDRSESWNMVNLAVLILVYSKYVSFGAWLKTWLPFILLMSALLVYVAYYFFN